MEPYELIVGSAFGEKEKAKSLRVKKLLEAAEAILKDAGCEVVRAKGMVDIILHYPPGTTRQELFPRSKESRYRVLLPNGIELQEVESRANGCVGLFILQETLPQRTAEEEQAE